MYKKIFMFILVIFSTFFMINTTNVEAYTGEVRYELTSYNSPEEKKDCESLFGDPNEDGTVANFLQQIFTIMGYAAPVLCTVLSIFDFVKATASQKNDNLTKAAKTTAKRIVLAIILFFLPTLINFLFPLLGWYGTCGLE